MAARRRLRGRRRRGLVHNTDRLDALREDAEGRDVHRLRAGVAHVDEARAALMVNPTEELLLEALASRLARLVART